MEHFVKLIYFIAKNQLLDIKSNETFIKKLFIRKFSSTNQKLIINKSIEI